MPSSPQTEALCFGCLSSQLVSGEQNLLETSYETTTFNSNTKLQAGFFSHARPCVRGWKRVERERPCQSCEAHSQILSSLPPVCAVIPKWVSVVKDFITKSPDELPESVTRMDPSYSCDKKPLSQLQSGVKFKVYKYFVVIAALDFKNILILTCLTWCPKEK